MPKDAQNKSLKEAQEVLLRSGVSERGVAVYTALLESGGMRVQEIVKATSIKRSTVYQVLEDLDKRQLVTSHLRGKRKFFQAEPPENWLLGLEGLVEKARHMLPMLSSLQPVSTGQPGVRFFHGLRGIKAMYLDSLAVLKNKPAEEREILCLTDADRIFKVWKTHYEDYIQRRIQEKIPIKILSGKDEMSRILSERGKKELRELKNFNIKQFPFPIEILIYADRVMFADLNKITPIGVIVESEGIAESLRSIFEMLWDSSS